jgi:hypothetical protein
LHVIDDQVAGVAQRAHTLPDLRVDAALDHRDDEDLRNGDQQDDQPQTRLGIEHVAQHAEQGPRLNYRGRNAISDKLSDRFRLGGDHLDERPRLVFCYFAGGFVWAKRRTIAEDYLA